MTATADAHRTVHVLPDNLVNQIAAGEVVERPASVIKELAENALDAGALRIDVAIHGGGVTGCRVADDGIGMSEADARQSVLRHATSKVSILEDLARIGTFGFRGEALPSIASVSRFRLLTRARGASEGLELRIDGGGEALIAPAGTPCGTVVEVRDLFFNVPARRKFLRALATESANVTEVVDGVALSRPEVTVTLERDGRVVREHLRHTSREERVRALFTGWELLPCVGQAGPLRVEAYLSRPEKARLGATALWLLVNGRPIRDRALARAIAHAYGSVLEPGRYPAGVVYLDLPPELVDVNVHPQKAEVRFADGRAVQSAAHRIIEQNLGPALTGQTGLRGTPPVPAFSRSTKTAPDIADTSVGNVVFEGSGSLATPFAPTASFAPTANTQTAALPSPVREDVAPTSQQPDALGELRFVAQVRGMFLLCETADALLVLDQHAAAERVTFARLKRAFHDRAVAMQTLLVPEIVEAPPALVALAEEAHGTILGMGIDVRPAGGTHVAVHAVPQLLARKDPAALATSILTELARSGGRDFSQAIDLALATMACHGSIRAGERVAPEQAIELCAALARIDFGGHCPHGRPVVMRLPFRELEHRVGRR